MKIFIIILCMLFLTSCNLLNKDGDTGTNLPDSVASQPEEIEDLTQLIPQEAEYYEEVTRIGNDAPVSRALAAKMISLINYDINDISNTEREITFTDMDASLWYDKFVNIAYIQNMMRGYGEKFLPGEALTLEHAQMLLDNIDPENRVKLRLTEENKDNPVSYALWTEMYKKFLENYAGDKSVYDSFGITEKDIIVLATPGSNSKLTGFNLISDTGPMTFSGLFLDDYIDKQVRVLTKGTEIIAALNIVTDKPRINNCYIASAGDGVVTIFTGGVERSYNYSGASAEMAGKICDITINSKDAESLSVYDGAIRDSIMRFDDKIFEFKEEGLIEIGSEFKVYSITGGGVKWKSSRDLITGTDIAEFIIKDSKVCAAVIDKKATPETIRVALSTSGFSSLYHDDVIISADTDFTVKYNGLEKKYKKGAVFYVSAEVNADMFGASRIFISTDNPGGLIEIPSISRNWPGSESPKYRGVIEIGIDNGRYTVVNEIGIEEYLYSVVPSEMPSGHGIEASKVQAVTARSYAYNQYFANRYHKYGGNVDDSVSCQVYNNIPENVTSITAVNETAGQCLLSSGSVVSANFFSTSAGMTANSGEVWSSSTTKQFPASTESYLKAEKQYNGADFGDLSNESNAEKFFKTVEIDSFDKGFAWFRWDTKMSAERITESVNANIKARYEANPRLIKTMQANGAFLSRPVETVGDVHNIEITKRGEGGNIMELKITGSESVVLVSTEYNVRALLRPGTINRYDGSYVENFGLMPSAFCVFDKDYSEAGILTELTVYGGGYGHGVGMSQNGVKGMIDKGYSFSEILSHYYNGCEIQKMY